MNTKNKKLIIFDFDGVIVDSFKIIYSVVRDAFKSVGISLSEQGYRDFFLINPKLAEQKLCNDEKKFALVQKYIHKNAPKRYRGVRIFPAAISTIKKLSEHATLAIVSSSQADVIEKKIKEYGLIKHFSLIFGADKALSKTEKLNEIINRLPADGNSIYFISDTVGDLNEGKSIGIKTIAATWGFHDKKILLSSLPEFIINNPEELLTLLI